MERRENRRDDEEGRRGSRRRRPGRGLIGQRLSRKPLHMDTDGEVINSGIGFSEEYLILS